MVDLLCGSVFVLTVYCIASICYSPRFQVGAMVASLMRLRDISLKEENDVLCLWMESHWQVKKLSVNELRD